jgi:hypothetical protein
MPSKDQFIFRFVTGTAIALSANVALASTTVHYQKQVTLNCSGAKCEANFPPPAANKQIVITRLSCILVSHEVGASLNYGEVQLITPSGTELLQEELADNYVDPDGQYITSGGAVDVLITSGQHLTAILESTQAVESGVCTASGTLTTLP